MKKNGASEDDEQNDGESENLVEVSSGESNEEFSEEILSHPPSDNESDCSEQSSEEPDEEVVQGPSKESDSEEEEPSEEEPFEESLSKESDSEEEEEEVEPSEEPFKESLSKESDSVKEEEVEPSEEPFKESLSKESDSEEEDEVEPSEELFEESLSQPHSDDGHEENEHSSKEVKGKPSEDHFDVSQLPSNTFKCGTTDSNEKKRLLDAEDGDNHLAKKSKPGQSLGPEISKACSNFANASEQLEHSEGSGKRRRSRWDSQPEVDVQGGETDKTNKRRKTRWAADDSQLKMLGPIQLPDFMKKLVEADLDPEVQELKEKLLKINKWLQRAEVHDERSRVERSPSPPHVNDEFGIKLDPRDVRFHEKLARDKQDIIVRLIEKNPAFKQQPPDYKPDKVCTRLYIPMKEYPDYNFVGLIIGPRGHTLKRMEKETGARIMLRGVGSSSKARLKPDPSDDEDLHVLIEAPNQKSLDDAVGMVEKLLIPVNEGMNEHKRAQLRELAELKGGTFGNQQKIGFSTPENSSCTPWQGGSTKSNGSTPTIDGQSSKEEANEANLIVRYLPHSVDKKCLKELFIPFGKILETRVIKDATGCSKGFGFVKYDNPTHAATAIACMDGYKMDGKALKVKVAGNPPTAGYSGTNRQPCFPGIPKVVVQSTPSPRPWPGPPGSMLSDPHSTTSNNFGLPHSSVFLGHSDSSCERLPSPRHHVPKPSLPSSLAQFPGNPDYARSQFSFFTPPSSGPSPLPYPTQSPSSGSSPLPYPTQSPSSGSISNFSWTPSYPPPGSGHFRPY